MFVVFPNLNRLNIYPPLSYVDNYSNNKVNIGYESGFKIKKERRMKEEYDYIKSDYDNHIFFPDGYSIYLIDEIISSESRYRNRDLFNFIFNIKQLTYVYNLLNRILKMNLNQYQY